MHNLLQMFSQIRYKNHFKTGFFHTLVKLTKELLSDIPKNKSRKKKDKLTFFC